MTGVPSSNVFGGLGAEFDRVAERRDDTQWIAGLGRRDDARYLLLDADGAAFTRADGEALRWLDYTESQSLLPALRPSLLGCMEDGGPRFLLSLDAAASPQALERALGAGRSTLREAGLRLAADEAGLFAYAKGLAHWQNETRHCHYCGAPVELIAAGHRARCSAETCGRLHFPRTDAAIIVIVAHGDACLLGRQANWPPGRYSTLAGFVEPGESLEDAVRREVAEEAGVRVDQVRYHSSQPWPMPASLMVGFTATAHNRSIAPRDGELDDARWFTADDIARGLRDGSLATPTPLSVSYQLIAHWLRDTAGLELDALAAQGST